ncbi:MAG: choice-of-anchor D domain-containing protein [Myxococcales bacterium]
MTATRRSALALLLALAPSGCGRSSLWLPQITVAPPALDFGVVGEGAMATRTLTISNVGPGSGDLAVSLSGDPAFAYSGPGNASLASGGSLALSLTFGPAQGGSFTGTLAVAWRLGTIAVPLLGRAPLCAGGSCQTSRYDPDAGQCVTTNLPDGDACPDPVNSCNPTGACQGGVCLDPSPPPPAPAGTLLWDAGFPGDAGIFGPVAADSSGNTYFDMQPLFSGSSSVFSLDACGRLRWWQDAGCQGTLVSGDQLVGFCDAYPLGALTAFDLASGQQLWISDTDALVGWDAGLSGTTGGYGPVVAARDGTIYWPVGLAGDGKTQVPEELLAADSNGVSRVFSELFGGVPTGWDFWCPTLLIDAAGNVETACGAWDSDDPAGRQLFEDAPLPVINPTGLGAGSTFTIEAHHGWAVNLDGGARFSEPLWPDLVGLGLVIDAAQNIYVGGQSPGGSCEIRSFAADGGFRWDRVLPAPGPRPQPAPYECQPVLGDGAQLFLLNIWGAWGAAPAQLAALDAATGAVAWTRTFAPSSGVWALILTSTGALVFADGNQIYAVSSGGQKPPADAPWPTPRGGPDQRGAALGR